jgi:hypothetical protein
VKKIALGSIIGLLTIACASGTTTAVASAAELLRQQNVELTNAAVSDLQSRLGLSESVARARFLGQPRLNELADALVGRLRDRQAGTWIDQASGDLVVNVLDAPSAATVRAAGAHAHLVRHSFAELKGIVTELGQAHLPAGTSWGIDPEADAVVVELPAGRQFSPAKNYGDTVILKQGNASTQTLSSSPQATTDDKVDLYGGLTINMGRINGPRCTAAFLARDPAGQTPSFNYLLTAGHCGSTNTNVYRGNTTIGYVSHSAFGPDDYASIALTRGDVWQPQPWAYTRSGPQPVNGGYTPLSIRQTVCMRGARTDYNCGQILAFNQTFTDGTHTVTGLVKTSLCAIPGDSGAPVMVPNGNGVLGVGIVSSGSTTSTGQCQNVTYYEPLGKALGSLRLATS